jgi:hypothetical protein
VFVEFRTGTMGLELPIELLLGGALTAPNAWDGRVIFTAAVAVLLPFMLTYILTSLKAKSIQNGRSKGNPPPAPYAVPVLANTFQFAYDTEGFIARTL